MVYYDVNEPTYWHHPTTHTERTMSDLWNTDRIHSNASTFGIRVRGKDDGQIVAPGCRIDVALKGIHGDLIRLKKTFNIIEMAKLSCRHV